MREYIIEKQDEGKRLDRWLSSELPTVSMGMMQKFLRLKRIKVNGKAAQYNSRLNEGDKVQMYLNDECFTKPKVVDPFLSKIRPKLDILYEDANILLVDKRPGLMCHPDAKEKVNTLITHAQAYIYQKGEWDSKDPSQFAPALCNRIDRFTGGIVIIAKTEEAMHVLNQKIRDREIEKRYLCIVHGRMHPAFGMLDNYISKAESTKRVTVLDKSVPGAQRAQTRYQTLDTRNNLSLMECELLTGRTHQIRAQFAHAKHPLLGDNQYGKAQQNEKYGRSFQALYAYKLVFRFKSDAGVLNDLNGKSWQVKNVPFVKEFFFSDEGKKRSDNFTKD